MNDEGITQEQMNEIARVYLKCRDVIMKSLKELKPDLSQEHLEHNAAAIIARLSHANLSIEELKL